MKIELFVLCIILNSCVSTKSTLANVDNTVPIPQLTANNTFVLSLTSNDPKYGYDQDNPINVFYQNIKNPDTNPVRFLNALAGPKGEKITFTKTGICCPFPTANIKTGAGFLDIYEINYQGLLKPITLYLNIYERGVIMAPTGLSIKKQE